MNALQPRRELTEQRWAAILPTNTRRQAVRQLHAGAAALSFSVLADSSLEHYRGGFYNPVMYVAPAVSALTLAASARAAADSGASGGFRTATFGTAALAGLVGAGFHVRNIARREGGFRWLNLFYGAPLGAPLGITLAGLFGLAAAGLSEPNRRDRSPTLFGRPAGPLLAAVSAAGLAGTAAEAGLLHFRGAFHDPFMYLPAVVPPLAAVALGAAALRPTHARRGTARVLLRSTAALGFLGMGFHAYGVQRNMGGWRNWSQNLFAGPPVPAPPSFTGIALAGLAALALLPGRRRE